METKNRINKEEISIALEGAFIGFIILAIGWVIGQFIYLIT